MITIARRPFVRRRPARSRPRRGVASILAMMFLVIFGSLAAAMAVVAQGNLRTADSALKVSRAMSAAETGLSFARRRMASEARRFVITQGVIDGEYSEDLWLGLVPSAEYEVLPPDGYTEGSAPQGLMEAVRNAHLADDHDIIVDSGDADLPEMDTTNGVLIVRPIAIEPGANAPYFRLRYEQVVDTGGSPLPLVRVTSIGVDGNITRTIQMDFRLAKRIQYAVLSPSRIMVGKNVMIEGPVGARYGVEAGELSTENGDPVTMRPDFYFLDPGLDDNLDVLYAAILDHDVDGDNRLRVNHPQESVPLGANPILADHTGDEYVDGFDLFLDFYDANDDGRVVWDAARAGEAAEFSGIDDQLARLIDEGLADRDGDGERATAADVSLGYLDGFLDANDLYAKVTGHLRFAVARADWEAEHGDNYQTIVQGPVSPGIEQAPALFEVDDEDLREITTDMFVDAQGWFESQVPGPGSTDFATQAAGQGGPVPAADWEAVPFGSSGAYDYYDRPVYRDMVFRNVRIPMGTNALFENCTFIGVTYIEAETTNTHVDWNYAGAVEPVDDGAGGTNYVLRFPDLPPAADVAGGLIPADTRTVSNNIRFDRCTFIGSVAGDQLEEYTHWRNKIQMTGATRFFIDPDDPDLDLQADKDDLVDYINEIDAADRFEMAKSSLMLPGWSVDVGSFSNDTDPDPDLTPSINLRGVVIAGVMDVRGTAEIFGTLLLTFRPTEDQGPLFYGGQPDAFNATIGYFGPDDGDDEGVGPNDPGFNGFGEIRLRYDPDALLPDGIPWPVSVESEPFTYLEGGS